MQRGNPIRSVAAVVLLSGGLASASPAGLISDVGAIPNPFSPNGDGVYDQITFRYTLAEQAWVVVTVEDSLQTIVRQFWSGDQEPGEYQYVWDGRDDWGALLPDGAYVLAIDAAGVREAEVVVLLDTEPPAVQELLVVPSRFSPDGDGVSDSLYISFLIDSSEPTDAVQVGIRDVEGAQVRLLFSGSGVDSVGVFWNGADDGGSAAPDTLYAVVIETGDAAENGSATELMVDLDTDPPALGVDLPDTTLTLIAVQNTSTVVTGWAYDRAGVDSIEVSLDGEVWQGVPHVVDPEVAGKVAWEHAVACTACAVGEADESATVRVRAYDGIATADGRGHVNGDGDPNPILEFDVVFDVAAPVHGSSTIIDDDDVYVAGETITIRTDWDATGYDVQAFFYQIDSEFDPESVNVLDEGVGLYTVTYTISEESTLVFSTPRRVRITASDYFHTVADSSVTVTVEEGEPGSYRVTVDENLFNPELGESVRIGLGAYSGTVSVDIYNLAGTVVRTIAEEVSGEDSGVNWDGTNGDDEVVASGVYFLRIQTDRDTHIRKVAVVK